MTLGTLRPKSLLLALTLIGVLLAALRLTPLAVANGERVTALAALTNSTASGSIDEQAWDAGWRSLCRPGAADDPEAASLTAAGFIARGLVDRGDYAGALAEFRQAAGSQDAAEARLASAYAAALEMRWLDAARLYPEQPTPRHQRFWGTVFYLAAQELMFRGPDDEAAAWYRRADQGYGVQGPYLGLELVKCLAQQGRTLEAFDAYRRALVVLPPEEALAHQERFEQMRLEALQAWRDLDPANPQVAAWLDFYASDRPVEEQERLAQAPQPQVALTHNLGNGRRLLGFDYRPEDIATGPFLWVDLYVQEGMAEGDPVVRLRRAVLNQAPNGSFTWDAAPDGVRPFGWHGFVYESNPIALTQERINGNAAWLCLDAGRLGRSVGAQSLFFPLSGLGQERYVQNSQVWRVGDSRYSVGRQWSGTTEQNPYSYTGNGPGADQGAATSGVWSPPADAEGFVTWLIVHQTGKACFMDNMSFRLP